MIPHCGSFLPNIYDRFIGISKILIPQGMMENIDVEASFKEFYFDLSGSLAPHLLNWLLTITSSDHILYGSDFPFTPVNQIENNLEALLTLLDREDLKPYKDQILNEKALRLFHKKD